MIGKDSELPCRIDPLDCEERMAATAFGPDWDQAEISLSMGVFPQPNHLPNSHGTSDHGSRRSAALREGTQALQ